MNPRRKGSGRQLLKKLRALLHPWTNNIGKKRSPKRRLKKPSPQPPWVGAKLKRNRRRRKGKRGSLVLPVRDSGKSRKFYGRGPCLIRNKKSKRNLVPSGIWFGQQKRGFQTNSLKPRYEGNDLRWTDENRKKKKRRGCG